MKLMCRTKVFWLVVITSYNFAGSEMGTDSETSGEYLQKVIDELQELNVPSSSNKYSLTTSSGNYNAAVYENRNHLSKLSQQELHSEKNIQAYKNQIAQQYEVLPSNRGDLHPTQLRVQPQYYRKVPVPVITTMREPEALGFTRAELAAMYKNALEKGSAVSLASLTNALASGVGTDTTETHVEIPVKKPMYEYYFFPLKTFAAELTKTHGYKTIPASAFETTEAAENRPTHIANPLFVAISTFISMALIFVMGIIFLPKLTEYGIIHAREMQDDLLHLSSFVANAIDKYSFLDLHVKSHLKSSRGNITNKLKRKRKKRGTMTARQTKCNK